MLRLGGFGMLSGVVLLACGGSTGRNSLSDGGASSQAGRSSSQGGRAGANGSAHAGAANSTSSGGAGAEAEQSGAGGDASEEAGAGGDSTLSGARRLPLPCTAPKPTGYCFVSDSGDYIGGGKRSSASGTASVRVSSNFDQGVSFDLENGQNGDYWSAEFAPGSGKLLRPGLYQPATRYPFQVGDGAGMSIYGNGAGCNELTGKFSVEELSLDPLLGVTRVSITFEQHCEGGAPALRGVINLGATGEVDPTPTPDRAVELKGKIFRVAYDAAGNIAYGLDATNRRLAKIALGDNEVTYANVIQTPNDGCVDAARQRLFVVNKGSNLISEYRSDTLESVRDIAWAGVDWGPTETHFKIYCAPDRLYVVDGAWSPGLFTVEGLDSDTPVVTDHTAEVAGVGGLVFDATASELYYWSQVGWSAGSTATSVHRLLSADLSEIDVTAGSVPSFNRNPLDAPLLLDETRGLIFVKNKIFDATNLTKVVYTLPSSFDSFDGAGENAYALDARGGRLSTKGYIYELTRYDLVAMTLRPNADQSFFDKDGNLWFLTTSENALEEQSLTH